MESKISSEFEVPRLGFLISGGLRPMWHTFWECIRFTSVALVRSKTFHVGYVVRKIPENCRFGSGSAHVRNFATVSQQQTWPTHLWACHQWWSRDVFFSETETLAKTEVSKQETSQDISDLVETRRDETRLRHSENVWDLRHCWDTGVKTWDEPKQFNINVNLFYRSTVNK